MNAPLEFSAFDPADLDRPAGSMVAHGVTIRQAGKIVAVGGLVRCGAHWWTFADIQPEARRAIVLHRLVLQALREADACGIRPIYGYCDETKPRALDWIKAIGFRLADSDEKDMDILAVEKWCGRPAWIRGAVNGR